MGEAKNIGAGLLPAGECRCFYLRHDLGTDLHAGIHEKMDPTGTLNTRLFCGGCGKAVAGRVLPNPAGAVAFVWVSDGAYFGQFWQLASFPR